MNSKKFSKRTVVLAALAVAAALAAIAGTVFYCTFFPNPFAQTVSPDQISSGIASMTGESDVLIAYFSLANNREYASVAVDVVSSASLKSYGERAYGHAELLAIEAQEATGGDVFPIKVQEQYPESYGETFDRHHGEMGSTYCPELSEHMESIDGYRTLILIYPNWLGGLPQPVISFLKEYDFSGKTVLPIATSQALGLGSGPKQIAEICPESVVAEGLSARKEDDVKKFLAHMLVEQKQ